MVQQNSFNIMPPYLPGGLEDIVNLVIPILQERGLFQRSIQETHYEKI